MRREPDGSIDDSPAITDYIISGHYLQAAVLK
jgi:hypothetical protein